ncbi:hypothetical protein [Rhizobium sp. R339]|uniref:hypothetical protein n=1 Tax=Rhizobium sp. R339 TaxID=1764273 RepID=UPI00167E6D12|nr:hypothetical protein [Rhizobium sp. R339]
MKLDFHVWLKLAVDRLLKAKPVAQWEPADAMRTRDDERDRSAREYEIHYWGAMPGTWY